MSITKLLLSCQNIDTLLKFASIELTGAADNSPPFSKQDLLFESFTTTTTKASKFS